MSVTNHPVTTNILVVCAAAIIVIAGLKYAAPMLIPFMLSVFLAVIMLPIMRWLVARKVPEVLAVVFILILLVLCGALMVSFIGGTVNAFYHDLPFYEARLNILLINSAEWLHGFGITMPDNLLSEYINPNSMMRTVTSVFNSVSGALTNTFLIGFTIMFILLEASGFSAKVKRAFGESTQVLQHFQRIGETVQNYLILKTIISVATGAIVWVSLVILEVPYAALWGMLAFLLNYIPNIGSIIAAVPPILISLISQDLMTTLMVCIMYIVVNTVIGNIIEPRVMGRSLGMSSLVVFVSLVFWGWVWGPVGMILSIPLTMMLKIILETNPKSRWMAILLDR